MTLLPTHFDRAFAFVVGIEGDYSDHPLDRGGKTRFGITQAVARAEGYAGPMSSLPLGLAKTIYRRRYWDALSLDRVASISYPVALELFDTGVNMGPSIAATFLQRSLNALNRRARDYADVRVDGAIGEQSLAALHGFFGQRVHKAEAVLLKVLNCLQGARYIDTAERRSANEDFVFGWFDNRIGM
ncbi:glycoside hydrolase family 108 protein [Pararobbsia alpina]|uniref:glycoside hydrolase family 108 protein n=1 Tax=Pararobbsia alpina TaxID=621374 RepID=UPI0039A4E8C1